MQTLLRDNTRDTAVCEQHVVLFGAHLNQIHAILATRRHGIVLARPLNVIVKDLHHADVLVTHLFVQVAGIC